jgi:hypothetical protein
MCVKIYFCSRQYLTLLFRSTGRPELVILKEESFYSYSLTLLEGKKLATQLICFFIRLKEGCDSTKLRLLVTFGSSTGPTLLTQHQ